MKSGLVANQIFVNQTSKHPFTCSPHIPINYMQTLTYTYQPRHFQDVDGNRALRGNSDGQKMLAQTAPKDRTEGRFLEL